MKSLSVTKKRKLSSSGDSSDDEQVKDTKTILKPPNKKLLKVHLLIIFLT